jgi:hypothetical protein
MLQSIVSKHWLREAQESRRCYQEALGFRRSRYTSSLVETSLCTTSTLLTAGGGDPGAAGALHPGKPGAPPQLCAAQRGPGHQPAVQVRPSCQMATACTASSCLAQLQPEWSCHARSMHIAPPLPSSPCPPQAAQGRAAAGGRAGAHRALPQPGAGAPRARRGTAAGCILSDPPKLRSAPPLCRLHLAPDIR